MVPKARIPDAEYHERIRRAARLAADKGLDVLLVNSNEADFSNARYFSGFWPLFETAGVAIAPTGEAALLVAGKNSILCKTVLRETCQKSFT